MNQSRKESQVQNQQAVITNKKLAKELDAQSKKIRISEIIGACQGKVCILRRQKNFSIIEKYDTMD